MSKVVLHVVGARPNYMKMAPVHAALAQRGLVDQHLVHTGQHYDVQLNDVFFAELPLPEPDVMLEVGSGSHAEQTARALVGLEETFLRIRAGSRGRAGRRQLDARRGARRREAQDPGLPPRGGAAQLRLGDARGAQPQGRRPPLERCCSRPRRRRSENLASRASPASTSRSIGNTMIDSLFANLARRGELAAWARVRPRARPLRARHAPPPRARRQPRAAAATIAALEGLSRELPVVFPMHPRTKARIEEAGIAVPERVPLIASALVHDLPVARARGGGGRDRLRRRSGGDDRARRPVLHAPRQHRAAGDRHRRHQCRPRPRPEPSCGDPEPAQRAAGGAPPAPLGRSGREAGSIRDRAHARRRARTVRLALSGAHPLRRRLSSPAACAGRRCRAVGTRSCRRG